MNNDNLVRQIEKHDWKDPYHPNASLTPPEQRLCGYPGCGLPYEASVHWDPFDQAPHEDPVPRMVALVYVLFAAVFVIGVVIGFVIGRLT